jgi:hypothetical protein
MAWSYEETKSAPYETVTQNTSSQERHFTQVGVTTTSVEGSLSIQSSNRTHITEQYGGTQAFLGTGGGEFTFEQMTDDAPEVVKSWESWVLESWSRATVGVARTTSYSSESRVAYTLNSAGGLDTTYRTSARRIEYHNDYTTIDVYSDLELKITQSRVLRTSAYFTFTNGETSLGTSEGGSSTSLVNPFVPYRTYQYTSGTEQKDETGTQTVTTTSTANYTVPTTTAATETTRVGSSVLNTTRATTTRATLQANVLTTETITATTALRSFKSGTFDRPCLIETIFRAETTDWAWQTTATGDAEVSSIATTVSDTTFSQNAKGKEVPPPRGAVVTESVLNGVSQAMVTWTDTYATRGTSSRKFTYRTTSSSSYTVGGPTTGGSLPFTGQHTLSVTYTTESDVGTRTFHTTATTSSTQRVPAWHDEVSYWRTYSGSLTSTRTGFDPTFTTTYFYGSLRMTELPDEFRGQSYESFSDSRAGTGDTLAVSGGFTRESTLAYTQIGMDRYDEGQNVLSRNLNQNALQVITATPPSFMEPAIGGGYQVYNSAGVGQPYGSNITLSTPLRGVGLGQIFTKVMVPILDQATRAYVVDGNSYTSKYDGEANIISFTRKSTANTGAFGSTVVSATFTESLALNGVIPATQVSLLENKNTIGGYGWKRDATDSSHLTAAEGIHRYTSYNAALGSTVSTMRWRTSAENRTISNGNAINIEPAPLVSLAPSRALTTATPPVLVFPAFPE